MLECRLFPLGQLLNDLRDGFVKLVVAVPLWRVWVLRQCVPLLSRSELTAAKRRPGHDAHALIFTHGDDLRLHIAESCVPTALIHRKRGETVPTSNWACQKTVRSWE